jgi:hypothetical protein
MSNKAEKDSESDHTVKLTDAAGSKRYNFSLSIRQIILGAAGKATQEPADVPVNKPADVPVSKPAETYRLAEGIDQQWFN